MPVGDTAADRGRDFAGGPARPAQAQEQQPLRKDERGAARSVGIQPPGATVTEEEEAGLAKAERAAEDGPAPGERPGESEGME